MNTQLKTILLALVVTLPICIGCQSRADEILQLALRKCQSIDNGYYEATKEIKMISDVDTFKIAQKLYFKKHPTDSALTFLYNSFQIEPRLGSITRIYTGDQLLQYSSDSVGIIIPSDELEVKKNRFFAAHWPVVTTNSYPLRAIVDRQYGDVETKLVAEEEICNQMCYVVEIVMSANYDDTFFLSQGLLKRINCTMWITKEDYIPIQFTLSKDVEVGGQMENHFEKYTLTHHNFNSNPSDTLFTASSVPPTVTLSLFRHKEPTVIPLGAKAPLWSGQTFDEKRLSSNDFAGKLLLLEFFYTSCPPCIEAMPDINRIYDKYNERGLEVVGVNYFASSDHNLSHFIRTNHIQFPVIVNANDIVEQFDCRNYPTTYLLDKEGKVLFYSKGVMTNDELNELRQIIEKNI